MDIGLHQITQSTIDHALSFKSAATRKDFGDDLKAKVAFTLRASTGMTGMES